MSIKTKSDIPFLKFLEFSEAIQGVENEDFVKQKVIDFFFKGQKKKNEYKILNFLQALQTDGKLRMRYKLDLSVLNTAGNFIDSENYAKDEDVKSLLELILKPKYFWQKVDVNKISITEGEHILANFLKG
jgi:hypothetical protein